MVSSDAFKDTFECNRVLMKDWVTFASASKSESLPSVLYVVEVKINEADIEGRMSLLNLCNCWAKRTRSNWSLLQPAIILYVIIIFNFDEFDINNN